MHIMNTQNQTTGNFSGVSDYTFDTFLVGDSNRFAHAVSLAVAEDSTHTQYNPLLIYGESGVGKTHLLHAIGQLSSKMFPHYNIVYLKCDNFINEFIEAVRQGKCIEFRENYKNADLLLMDDIQFIAGKIETQNEMLNTFSTLYDYGKQIVLASDRPPYKISTLEGGLRARFESGLMADIMPPDNDLRRAIIKSKATRLGIDLPDEVVYAIVRGVFENLEDIHRVHASADVITLDYAIEGIPVPIHPGAIKYYKEVGVM